VALEDLGIKWENDLGKKHKNFMNQIDRKKNW
jgi:hypothetical protein